MIQVNVLDSCMVRPAADTPSTETMALRPGPHHGRVSCPLHLFLQPGDDRRLTGLLRHGR